MIELATEIKADWDHFFAIVNADEDWITPLLSSIEGVTVEEAFWRPAEGVASIAEIMLHATGWLETILRGILGGASADNIDWPESPAPSKEAWAAMVERLHLTVADLGRALHNLSVQEIYEQAQGQDLRRSRMITNILVHNAYHAGQIVKLRQAHEAVAAVGRR